MTAVPEIEALEFRDADAWAAWLSRHHDDASMAWLRIAKRHSGLDLISIGDALDVALCFGWIDGHRKGLDDASFLQRYSRRTRRSPWSRINRGKAEALLAVGRMQPAGLAVIEAARADGRWDAAYDGQREASKPGE
jgi:uncharacterized protein YdeI (YjbR/CyaY-like superfamily)